MQQLSEKGKKSETKSKEFVPCVKGQGKYLKPCSSADSEPLVSLGSDDWNANFDVALDTTENDTDSTLNDSTMKCLPFLSNNVSYENSASIDQAKEASKFVAWPCPNHFDDVSQQLAMSPFIPQQTSIFPKASAADQDEHLFSDHSDDDDNGISSLEISALVDDLQKTPIVDEPGRLLQKTLHLRSNVVSSPLKCQKEAISRSPRSDDSDHFNLDFSDVVNDVTCDDDDDDVTCDDDDDVTCDDDDDVTCDDDDDVACDDDDNVTCDDDDDVTCDDDDDVACDDGKRSVVEKNRNGKEYNVSDEESIEDEDCVNENEEEHSSGNYGGNIQYLDMEEEENVDENFHGIINNEDNNIHNVDEEDGHGIMMTRRKRGCSSAVKRKPRNAVNDLSHKKAKRSFIGSLNSPTEGQKSAYIYQRHNQLDSSTAFELHDQGQNSAYQDQDHSDSEFISTPSKDTSVKRQLECKGKDKSGLLKELMTCLAESIDSKKEVKASSPLASSSSSQETSGEMPLNSSQHDHFPPEGDPENVTTLVTRCKSIMEKIRQVLRLKMDVLLTHRVQALSEELGKMEKWSVPQTVIAMMGNTGDGKSSLMNALLGHSSILPTSGIRACTAVVVEVVKNNGSMYQGCIEFLTKEEWYRELKQLLKDLTLSDGNLRKNPPEQNSDLYVSYCKVKAVYGRIDKFEVLAGIDNVTSYLGQKKTVNCKEAGELRIAVEKYIETQEPQSGGQFWPIVKRVQLRLPNCDVCRTGAALIDLPGVRDSNAARDKIARDYLKNCSNIWVVSAMHRAIDDKTAQDLLSENFRRQLLMDGHYGSVAFICTKSDQFEKSETIRTLKLQDKCGDHEKKICFMEREKQRLQEEMKNCKEKEHNLNAEIETSQKKIQQMQLLVQDIDVELMYSSNSSDPEQPVDCDQIEKAKLRLKEIEKKRQKNKEAMEEITQDIQRRERQIQNLETQIRQRRRKISHICASARNDYCREKVKQKFRSDLKEIKRQANRLQDDEDEDDDEDDEEVMRMGSSLRVFCCSSTEYQKMKDPIHTDGEPIVFNSPEETEIPSLKEYVHELTRVSHDQYQERLIRGLGSCIFGFESYLLDGGTECGDTRTSVKSVIKKYLQDLSLMIQSVLDKMAEDLDRTFIDMIQPKLHEGVGQAAQEAISICEKWGSKQSTDPANRRAGGLHWTTYKATMRRLGVYSSKTYGDIDFNEELCGPFKKSIIAVWNLVFSSDLWRILETVQAGVLEKIKHFNRNASPELQTLGVPADRIGRVKEQLESSVNYKLTEMVQHLKLLVTTKQRDINRILSRHVQLRLEDIYILASSRTGKGAAERSKQEMQSGIDERRLDIFEEGSQKIMHELLNLKKEMENAVSAVCKMLQEDINLAFEPLWEAPSQSEQLRDTFQQHMEEICEEMRTIYMDANLQNMEEQVQSQKKPSTTQHPPTLKGPQERKSVIDIVKSCITQVSEELTKMKNVEGLKVETGSNMYPVKDVKLKPGLSSDSGMHSLSDVVNSLEMDVTRVKMEVLSESSESMNQYNSESPVPPSPTAGPSSDLTNPTFSSMAGQSDVYDFGEASMSMKNNQHDQTPAKVKARAKQIQNSKAHRNEPPEFRIALEHHMAKRSTETLSINEHETVSNIEIQQTKNSSTATTLKKKAENTSKGSGGAMDSLLKPMPWISGATRVREQAEHSFSDTRQLIVSSSKSIPRTSTVQVKSSKKLLQVDQKGTSSLAARISLPGITRTSSTRLVGSSASGKAETISDKKGTTSAGKMGTSSSRILEISSSGNSAGTIGSPIAYNAGSSSAGKTETSSSGRAGTSLIGKKGTTSRGTEGNSSDIKGNPSSDVKRTSTSRKTGTTSSSIETSVSDKVGTSLPTVENRNHCLPEISLTKRRKQASTEQENPTRGHGTGKVPQGKHTDTSLSTSSVSSRPRLLAKSETEATTSSKAKNSKVTGSSKGPQRKKLRVEHPRDRSLSPEMSQIIKRQQQDVHHLPRQQQYRRCKRSVTDNDIIDLTGSDDE